MTDADVDGSHIRTLLLTFFYRQMPELVQNGHVYIAQPPLYKVKKGKHERYLKDDQALNQHFLDIGLQGTAINLVDSELTSEQLDAIGRDYLLLGQIEKRLATRFPAAVLSAFRRCHLLGQEVLSDRTALDSWCEDLRTTLALILETHQQVSVRMNFQTPSHWALEIQFVVNGSLTSTVLDREFFVSSEYQHLARLGQLFDGSLAPGSGIQRGAEEAPIQTLGAAFADILEQARKGSSVQRYKGLGEMNPDQLWETTMSSETRNLMQVRIEDAVAADQIFSTLMGDQVEPRREFIERHARTATNLDT